jgi:DNA-directed RNA polymerase subunit RPC12/RpoP
MWQVLVVCSDCAEETEVLVEDLDDLDREVCPCGYSRIVLSVSNFEPVHAEQGQLVELPRRRKLQRAA